MKQAALGIFDSGLGGLTVFSALHRSLPQEPLVYLGDTARVPYGNKSAETIQRYAREDAQFLIQRGVKALVVACNTASAFALKSLQQEFQLPIFGVIEPGVRAAAAATRNKKIGVLGTRGTITSGAYEKELLALDPQLKIFAQACPLFVPFVEEGWHESAEMHSIAAVYAEPLLQAGVDTVILGCTHYPLLKPVLSDIFGARVQLIDAGRVLAEELKLFLETQHLLAVQGSPHLEVFVTDIPQRFAELGRVFFGDILPSVKPVVVGR